MERDEARRHLRDAERYAAEQESAYADLTVERDSLRSAVRDLLDTDDKCRAAYVPILSIKQRSALKNAMGEARFGETVKP